MGPRIAVVAPAFGDTGGPEVATMQLVNSLIKKGVDVTLFAPGDWKTKAKHIVTLEKSLWNMADFKKQSAEERRDLIISSQMKVLDYQDNFDLIHLNVQKYAYLVAKKAKIPCILTLHNKVTDEQYKRIKDSGIYAVALSEERKEGFDIPATAGNGIDVSSITPSYEKGNYLIAIGRLTETKGIHQAISISKETGKKLIVFGRIGNAKKRQSYYHTVLKPNFQDDVEYRGEVSQKEIISHLRGAEALLFPIEKQAGYLATYPLIVMEALACGTPVIGTPIKATPMIAPSSKIGFFSNDYCSLKNAILSLEVYDRKSCRSFAEKYLDSSVMADKYINIYKEVLDN